MSLGDFCYQFYEDIYFYQLEDLRLQLNRLILENYIELKYLVINSNSGVGPNSGSFITTKDEEDDYESFSSVVRQFLVKWLPKTIVEIFPNLVNQTKLEKRIKAILVEEEDFPKQLYILWKKLRNYPHINFLYRVLLNVAILAQTQGPNPQTQGPNPQTQGPNPQSDDL